MDKFMQMNAVKTSNFKLFVGYKNNYFNSDDSAVWYLTLMLLSPKPAL